MTGMIGLALATALDYFFKTPGSYVPIWSPARLLGTVAGALLVYGATVAVSSACARPTSTARTACSPTGCSSSFCGRSV